MSDSLSWWVLCPSGAKRRATVPPFKAVCLSLSRHPPRRLCLNVYLRGPKVAQLRSVLRVWIEEECHPESDVHEANMMVWIAKVEL